MGVERSEESKKFPICVLRNQPIADHLVDCGNFEGEVKQLNYTDEWPVESLHPNNYHPQIFIVAEHGNSFGSQVDPMDSINRYKRWVRGVLHGNQEPPHNPWQPASIVYCATKFWERAANHLPAATQKNLHRVFHCKDPLYTCWAYMEDLVEQVAKLLKWKNGRAILAANRNAPITYNARVDAYLETCLPDDAPEKMPLPLTPPE